MNGAKGLRQVLECASPLALWVGLDGVQSGRGQPQSKTLARMVWSASSQTARPAVAPYHL
jgi:hypothetical protein